jgi:hypothetical protein
MKDINGMFSNMQLNVVTSVHVQITHSNSCDSDSW